MDRSVWESRESTEPKACLLRLRQAVGGVHLLGITTFQFKVGQNLNFAGAAEEFAQERDETATR